MRSIEEGVIRQTGKPLPPVVIADDGKAPQAVPYSALLTGVLLKRVILGFLCADCHERCAVHTN